MYLIHRGIELWRLEIINQEILDQFASDLSRSSDHTLQARLFYGKKFLEFTQGKSLSEWNKTLVNEFENQLEAEGYAPGTKRFILSIVKRVFDAAKTVYELQRTRLISEVNPNDSTAMTKLIKAISLPGPNWDLGKRWMPNVETSDIVKPASTFDELTAMIAATKNGGPEAAYLALSSIYGLRRVELHRVRREHLDFGDKTIYVMTAKGGERRKQLLCDEVIPILMDYSFAKEYSPFKMSELYGKICAKAGVELKEGSGWHSPRRFLDTALVSTFGELPAHIFLRWKISSSSLMIERYFSRSPLEVDREILTGGHPLVKEWKRQISVMGG